MKKGTIIIVGILALWWFVIRPKMQAAKKADTGLFTHAANM